MAGIISRSPAPARAVRVTAATRASTVAGPPRDAVFIEASQHGPAVTVGEALNGFAALIAGLKEDGFRARKCEPTPAPKAAPVAFNFSGWEGLSIYGDED
jgi:hypothetical protein